MKRIVISEFMDATSVERLRSVFDVAYDPKLVDDRDRLAGLVADAEGLIVRNRTQVDAGLLSAAPKLSIVGRLGVGLDNIDVAACRERGIAVVPATGANSLAVAEYVLAAALTLVRGVFGSTQVVIAGEWPRQRLMGGELSGRILGLVGFGAIAREVAARARAFGMHIAAYDPLLPEQHPTWADAERLGLDDLLARADVISLHVPLTEDTRHIIDAGAIARMKPNAIVINTARGGVVDDVALAAALRERRIGGAALDVMEVEPVTAESGRIFSGLDNLILTPHIAGVTAESNVRVSAVIAEAVIDALKVDR